MALKYARLCWVFLMGVGYLVGEPAVTFKVKNDSGETITFEPYKLTQSGTWIPDAQGLVLVPPHGRPVDVRQRVGAGDLSVKPSVLRMARVTFASGKKPPCELRIEVTTLPPHEENFGGACPICRAMEPFVYGSFAPSVEGVYHTKVLIFGGLTGGIPTSKRLFQSSDLIVEAYPELGGSQLRDFPLIQFTFKKV